MRQKRMRVVQNVWYSIQEWDGTVDYVRVWSRGAKVVSRCMNGDPHLCVGGGVYMKYRDGVCHRVSSRYFESIAGSVVVMETITPGGVFGVFG